MQHRMRIDAGDRRNIIEMGAANDDLRHREEQASIAESASDLGYPMTDT
jgi:hypothetical protein